MTVEPMVADGKFADLVHYVCKRAGEHNCFGATILNKIMWFSEVTSYLDTGKPLTGAKYIKRQFGPVPDKINQIITSLKEEGKITVSEVQYYNKTKKHFLSLTEPNLERLSGMDIDIVSRVIDYICENHSATSISDMSHDDIWHAAMMGEEIPLCAMLASRSGAPNSNHIKWADNCISQKRAA